MFLKMESTSRFYDVCVPFSKNEKEMKEIIEEMIELGYKTIAIDQEFDHTKVESKSGDIFPNPMNIKLLIDHFKNRIKILQRITIIYVDLSITPSMTNSMNLRKFDIIAGMPKSDAALLHCCTTFNCDLVTFGTEVGIRLLINRKAYKIAVKRKLYFEVKYSPLIVNSSIRKDVIKLTTNYFTVGNSKNIIISSGARNAFQIRGPYDVANLAYIFGLNEAQGISAIDRCCRDLIARAESRRMGRTIMVIKSSGPIVFPDLNNLTDSEADDNEDSNNEDDLQSDNDEKSSNNQNAKDKQESNDSNNIDDDNDNNRGGGDKNKAKRLLTLPGCPKLKKIKLS